MKNIIAIILAFIMITVMGVTALAEPVQMDNDRFAAYHQMIEEQKRPLIILTGTANGSIQYFNVRYVGENNTQLYLTVNNEPVEYQEGKIYFVQDGADNEDLLDIKVTAVYDWFVKVENQWCLCNKDDQNAKALITGFDIITAINESTNDSDIEAALILNPNAAPNQIVYLSDVYFQIDGVETEVKVVEKKDNVDTGDNRIVLFVISMVAVWASTFIIMFFVTKKRNHRV